MERKIVSIILLLSFIIGIAGCGGKNATTSDMASERDMPELVHYIGKPVSVWEEGLSVKFAPCSPNSYKVNQRDKSGNTITLFVCTTDESGNVIKVQLIDSGDVGYTLCGILSTMDKETAQNILRDNGVLLVSENIWKCPNDKDVIIFKSEGWTYEKDYSELSFLMEKNAVMDVFSYQYEDSLGTYYLGNGQIIEYMHDSFAEMVYYYGKLTDYSQQEYAREMDGRYVMVSGEVSAVSTEGVVYTICVDEERSAQAGLLWPMQGSAELNLVPEQKDELINIQEDSIILAFGRIDMNSYEKMLMGSLTLYDGIVISINGNKRDVPVISGDIPGFQRFSFENGIAIPVEEHTVVDTIVDIDQGLNPYDAFFQTHEWYDDLFNGGYRNESEGLYFDLVAGKSEDGSTAYIISINTIAELGGFNYIHIPSTSVVMTNYSSTITFAIDEYYPEYSGNMILEIRQKENGGYEYFLWSNISGILQTGAEFLPIDCFTDDYEQGDENNADIVEEKTEGVGYVMEGTGGLNIRNGPGSSYEQIGRLPEGEKVIIYETQWAGNSEWGRIERGWICMDYIQSEAINRSNKTNTVDGYVMGGTGGLNVRSGPGVSYEQVGRLAEGEYIVIYETQWSGDKEWGRIDSGWVCMDYIQSAVVNNELSIGASNYGEEATKCSDYAPKVALAIKGKFYYMFMGGVEIVCDYSPSKYTFTTTVNIHKDGLFGGAFSFADAIGEDVSFNQDGVDKIAEDIYYEHFYPEGYYGITCVFQINEYGTNQYVSGTYSGISNQGIVHDYARTRDFVIENGVLIEYLGNDEEITIPEGVEVVGKDVFARNKEIRTVYMPSTLISIEQGAFWQCLNLSNVYFQEGLKEIGYDAFYHTNIKSITIPISVTWIGEHTPETYGAFEYCSYLRDVYYAGTVEQWLSAGLSVGEGIAVHCQDGDV